MSTPPSPSGDAVRYTRPQLLRLSRSPKVAKAGQLVLSSAQEGGVRMPRFKEWFGDLPLPSPPQSRPSPNSPPASRARSSRNGGGGEGSSSSAGASGRDRDRDRPPHHTSGTDKASGAAAAIGSSGGMGAFRHASTRGEKRSERGLARDEGEEKGGLRKMAESFDRGERVPKSWGARASDATAKDTDRDADKDSAPSGRDRERDDTNWGKGDWRSRAAGLPSKPALPSGSTSSVLPSTSSTNGMREGGSGRTAPGRPAWNPAPAIGSLDDRSARERGDRIDRNDRGDRRRRGGDDDDETPAWMRADSSTDALEKSGSRKGRTRTSDEADAFGGSTGGRRRDEKAEAAPAPTADKRDGEDAIMRFKREMRERDGLIAPPQESTTSATTPAATVDSTKPVSTGMFDHLTRPPPMTANSAPLLPPSNAASTVAPGSGLFRDPAILSSPASSPSMASAAISGAVGSQKRAPGGSRFAKFFTEEPKKAPAGAPVSVQQVASSVVGGQAIPQVGNLMSILAGGSGGGGPQPPSQQHSNRTGEESNQMNKLLAMLQSSHAPEPSHTRSQLPPPQPQANLDFSALSLGGRPPAGIPPLLQHQHQHQRSRPASPAFGHQQHQAVVGRYPPGMNGERSIYDHPAPSATEPQRRQERDHLQVLLDAQAQQQRAANSNSPLVSGGGYSVDQLRQLQQMDGGGGQRTAPSSLQQQQNVYRGQTLSPPPQGNLPPPNAAEIQNHLLRQMMMGGTAPTNGLHGSRGPTLGHSNGSIPSMGPPHPPPPLQPHGRQERYLDQLLASQQSPLVPPKQVPQAQQPYLDPSQMANQRQQQYIDSLRQQQQQSQSGYPGLDGMGVPPPPPPQQQQQYGGYSGGFGGPPPPQQDLMSLLRNGNTGLGRQ